MPNKPLLNIAGVPIDELNAEQAIDQTEDWLLQDKSALIVTPNSEMIMLAQRDNKLRQALSDAQLRLADSVGVTWAVSKLYSKRIDRISGSDFAYSLVELADRQNLSVLLVSRSDGLDPTSSETAKSVLSQRYKGAKLHAYVFDNTNLDVNPKHMQSYKADIILLGLGTPLAEVWAAQHLSSFKKPTIMLCCGGGIDFIAGIQKRAPKLMRKLGFEWLWRLIRQPKRIFRQFALVKFVRLILKQKHSRTG